MSIREMQNFEVRGFLFWDWYVKGFGFGDWWEGNIPFMEWVVNVLTSVSNDEAADFFGTNVDSLQDVNNF